MTYAIGNTPAAVAYQGSDYRTFVMGFPFESIREETSRNVIMASILRFLTTVLHRLNTEQNQTIPIKSIM